MGNTVHTERNFGPTEVVNVDAIVFKCFLLSFLSELRRDCNGRKTLHIKSGQPRPRLQLVFLMSQTLSVQLVDSILTYLCSCQLVGCCLGFKFIGVT